MLKGEWMIFERCRVLKETYLHYTQEDLPLPLFSSDTGNYYSNLTKGIRETEKESEQKIYIGRESECVCVCVWVRG